MTVTELGQRRGIIEKGLWWTKMGGILAGVLGILSHWANLAVGGVLVAAGSIALERTVKNTK